MSKEAVKICLVGDTSVGKTCIVNRLVKGIFNTSEKSTIGSNFVTESVPVNGEQFRLAIWDTAGQEKYRSMVSMYYRGSFGAMIVYDITHPQSFQNVRVWHEELRYTEKDIPVIIVGNKTDMESNRIVTKHDGSSLAKELNCLFMEVSALKGDNIVEAFVELAKNIKLPTEQGLQYGLDQSKNNQNTECC